MTDKAIDQAAERPDRETFIFNRMMTQFIDHYQPRDLRERSLFAADIMSLMRQATLHQAEIYDRVIRAALGPCMPLTPSIFAVAPVVWTDQPKENPDGVATPAAAEPPAT